MHHPRATLILCRRGGHVLPFLSLPHRPSLQREEKKRSRIDANNKQSVAGPYGNYVESGRARIRLLYRPSADHMRYTLHTVCGTSMYVQQGVPESTRFPSIVYLRGRIRKNRDSFVVSVFKLEMSNQTKYEANYLAN